jgi:hypothetical protein
MEAKEALLVRNAVIVVSGSAVPKFRFPTIFKYTVLVFYTIGEIIQFGTVT